MKTVLSLALRLCRMAGSGDTAYTQDFPDPLLIAPTSLENIAAGLEADAYQTGLSAYIWGYRSREVTGSPLTGRDA